jgi:hypothetical protein
VTSGNPIDKKQTTENTRSETCKERNHSKNPVSPIPASIESQSQKPHTHCEITCTTGKNWWDKTKPFVEVGGILLLLAYTIYTIRMYYANKDAADAAKSSADTASRSLLETNRSWIEIRLGGEGDKPRTVKKILADLKSLALPLVFTNIGKFPIKDILIEGNVEVIDSSEPVSFHPASAHFNKNHSKEGMNILFPSRSGDFLAAAFPKFGEGTETPNPSELNERDKKGLADGSKYVMVFARGTFRDAFGKHWVEFCEPIMFAAGQGKYGDCINYNDAGDGDMPDD